MSDAPSAASSTAPASPRPKKTRAEYLAWIEQERPRRGEAWYNEILARMKARDAQRNQAYQEAREVTRRQWMDQVTAWSAGGGFDAVVQSLCTGPVAKIGRTRFQYRIGGVKFEVNFANRTCTRWDGATFANGKRGMREALGLATAVFELAGDPRPFLRAKETVMALSGIGEEQVKLGEDTKRRLEEMRRQQQALAIRLAEEANREDPLSAEDQAVVPLRVTDRRKIEDLTRLMARERAFPLDYARRAVQEGVIWFGEWRYRDRQTGEVVNSHRPLAVSDVIGMETGVLLGHASREFKAFFRGPAKGKNLGRIQNGFVVIGRWSAETKRIIITEGVYSGLALRLLRERRGRPLGADEAILVPAGSRDLERLLAHCQKRGIEVISAYDCDPAGLRASTVNAAWCAAHGVKHTVGLPPLGEATWSFRDDAWGREHYVQTARRLAEMGQLFHYLPASGGRLHLVLRTTAAACALHAELKRSARELEEAEFTAWLNQHHPAKAVDGRPEPRDPDEVWRLQLEYQRQQPMHEPMAEQWHRKDWNELLQHEYHPRAKTAGGLPEACPEAESELRSAMRALGFTDEEAESLRAAGTVFPGLIDGHPFAIWPALAPDSPTPLGYQAVPLGTGLPRSCGATWAAAVTFGRLERAPLLVAAGDLKHAGEAWRRGGEAGVVCAIGPDLPKTYLDLAAGNETALACAFDRDEPGVAASARVMEAARARGIKLAAMPEAVPALGVSGP
ncbi:MAG: hypothetical protein PHE83_14880 [Opitutaceae bacterium]|nr:hypothetical protein [Opitutaceae bacterium]